MGSDRNFFKKGKAGVRLYTQEAFEAMDLIGQLTARALDEVGTLVRPGVTTNALDRYVRTFALDHGVSPAPLYYRGFPKAICTSINHVVCHGIPSDTPLREGEIVNIDVTLVQDGWHGDKSRMYGVGDIPRKAQRLLDVTYESLRRAILVSRPGATLGDIGHAIASYARSERCSVVEDFCGHGVGLNFHEPPHVMHFGTPGEGLVLEPGMIFTIEPMINLGKYGVKILSDGWTAVTRDRSLSAQYEHTIGITETGCQIFTRSEGEAEMIFTPAG